MAERRITLRSHIAGWLRCYLMALIVLRHFTGWAPSAAHIERVVARGVRYEVVR